MPAGGCRAEALAARTQPLRARDGEHGEVDRQTGPAGEDLPKNVLKNRGYEDIIIYWGFFVTLSAKIRLRKPSNR